MKKPGQTSEQQRLTLWSTALLNNESQRDGDTVQRGLQGWSGKLLAESQKRLIQPLFHADTSQIASEELSVRPGTLKALGSWDRGLSATKPDENLTAIANQQRSGWSALCAHRTRDHVRLSKKRPRVTTRTQERCREKENKTFPASGRSVCPLVRKRGHSCLLQRGSFHAGPARAQHATCAPGEGTAAGGERKGLSKSAPTR